MRIYPLMNNFNANKTKVNRTQFEKNELPVFTDTCHQYTGVASVDLAYVSMFDNKIAQDLKLMGLI